MSLSNFIEYEATSFIETHDFYQEGQDADSEREDGVVLRFSDEELFERLKASGVECWDDRENGDFFAFVPSIIIKIPVPEKEKILAE